MPSLYRLTKRDFNITSATTVNHALDKVVKNDFDVVANTLLAQYNIDVAKAAIKVGVSVVDLGYTPLGIYDLNESAIDAGVTVLPSCGLDPGIDRILKGYAIANLDQVEKIHMWCGGFPQKNTPGYHNPLRYKIAWAWHRAINGYLGTAKIIRNGKIIEVEKLIDPEIIRFREPIGECEAIWSNASFDLLDQLELNDVPEVWNKTVRWKGHCEIWRKLIELGLTDKSPLNVQGNEITPFEFLDALGTKNLQYEEGEGDMIVLRVEVHGKKQGEPTTYQYELIDFYDEKERITAMGRTTTYPCSIACHMIANGDIRERGVIHAGKIGQNTSLAKLFISKLAEKNIRITESVISPFI